jgi:DNA-binding YbaB/EbfC family protein
MSFDMNKLMKQAAEMQKQLEEAQEAAKNEVVEGSAGGVVTVKASGEGKLLEVKIDPQAIDPDDPETLEDLVLAAVNNALENADSLMKSKMGGLMGGLGLPGM